MHVKLRHQLSYTYDQPVQLGGHRICLMPRPLGSSPDEPQSAFQSRPEVRTDPAGGDQIQKLQFIGHTDRLEVAEQKSLTSAPPPLGLCSMPNHCNCPTR